MKICKDCGERKHLEEFRKSGKYYRPRCKICAYNNKREKYPEDQEKKRVRSKARYQRKKEEYTSRNREYYQKNSDSIKKRMSEYYDENKEKIRIKQNLYYNTEKGFRKHSEKRVKRILASNNATVPFSETARIKEFYSACPQGFHVDHIIPIRGEEICGLNVLNNLQYLTERENTSKKNKFDGTEINTSWRKNCYILKRVSTPDNLKRENRRIQKKEGNYEFIPMSNKITTHFNPHFYEVENKLWEDKTIRKRLIDNRRKYLGKSEFTDSELLRGFKVSGLHYGFSHHSPFWIKKFIQDFNITSVYDPCGGWGHRLLGSHDITYIYNDIDERSVRGAMDMTNFLQIFNKKFYNKDAASLTPKEDYQAVFTCPPYFDTELYQHPDTSTNKYKDLYTWLNKFWRGVIKSSIKPGVKYFAFIVSNKYRDSMNAICLEENLKLHFETKVGKPSRSHLNKSSDRDNRENLLVYKV